HSGTRTGQAAARGLLRHGDAYAETIGQQEIRIEGLTPIAKLTNGFSVTLFTKRDGPLKSWADLAAAKPLKVSSPMRATSTYIAELMIERKGGLATEVTTHADIPGVDGDVVSGRSDAGILATSFVAQNLDRLQPIISFGAGRSALLGQTPTFAEVTGNPKAAF